MSAIDEDHRNFAEALVALARAHKMDNLSVTFSKSFSHLEINSGASSVQANWSEGRHGSRSSIHLSAETVIQETIQQRPEDTQ